MFSSLIQLPLYRGLRYIYRQDIESYMSKSTVSTTVPREVKNQLDEKAESRDLTRSEIAREILESGVEDEPSWIEWLKYQIGRNATTIAVIWIFSVLIGGLDSVITLSTGLLVLGMMIYSLLSYD